MATAAQFIALWSAPRDTATFDGHYHEVHIPLAKRMPGIRRFAVSRNVALAPDAGAYYLVAELDFDDMATLRAALQSPEGRAVSADVVNLQATGASLRTMVCELEEV
jgi:uncharacterized protein (TIGR02118 family)